MRKRKKRISLQAIDIVWHGGGNVGCANNYRIDPKLTIIVTLMFNKASFFCCLLDGGEKGSVNFDFFYFRWTKIFSFRFSCKRVALSIDILKMKI